MKPQGMITPVIGYSFPINRIRTEKLQGLETPFYDFFAETMAVGGLEIGFIFQIFLHDSSPPAGSSSYKTGF